MIAETSTVRTDILQSRTAARRGSTQDASSLLHSQLLKLILEIDGPLARTSGLPGFHALAEGAQVEQADVVLLVCKVGSQAGHGPLAVRSIPLDAAVQQGAGGKRPTRSAIDDVREELTLVGGINPRRERAAARNGKRVGRTETRLEFRLTYRTVAVRRVPTDAIGPDCRRRYRVRDGGATDVGAQVFVLESRVACRCSNGQFADRTRVDLDLVAVD